MNKLNSKTRTLILRLLVEGNSIRATAPGSVVARMVAMVLTFQSIVSPAATGPSAHVAKARTSMVAATMARKRSGLISAAPRPLRR